MNASVYPLPETTAQGTMPVVVNYSAVVQSIERTSNNACHYRIASPDSQGESGLMALAAEDMLMQPEEGDVVLCVKVAEQWFITQLLKRAQPKETLQLTSSRTVEWAVPSFRIKALNELELLSANRLTISARDLLAGASRSLVQQAHNFLQKATTFSLNTKGLMQITGKQQVIVAEEDLRMDGKRINMG